MHAAASRSDSRERRQSAQGWEMVGHRHPQPKESEISQQLEASIVGTISIDLHSHSPHVGTTLLFRMSRLA